MITAFGVLSQLLTQRSLRGLVSDTETSGPLPPVAGSHRRAWRGAFSAVGGVLLVLLVVSRAPSPVHVVFALYVFGLLGSLLVVGALSDHLGRRPVLAASIGLEAVALVLFLVAGDVLVLAAARVLQGIATGAATTALSATLVDLEPRQARGRAGVVTSVAPLTGLALGAVGSGVLVEFAPAPTRLV